MNDLVEMKRRGNVLFAERKYAEAEACFREMIRRKPELADGYVGLAKVLDGRGDVEGIVRELAPVWGQLGSTQVLKYLSTAYRALVFRGHFEHMDDAIRVGRAYLDKREDPVALAYLADIYFEGRNDFESALALYKRALAVDPRDEAAFNRAVKAAEKLGKLDEIIALREMKKSTPLRTRG